MGAHPTVPLLLWEPMSERDDVQEWQQRIREAQRWQEEAGRVENWKRARAWYDGDYGDHVFSVNHVFAIGRGLVPSLYFKNPTIVVRPVPKVGLDQARAQAAGRALEAIDSWLIPHIGLKQQIKLGILDSFTANMAVFKTGYHSIGTELPRQRPPDTITQQMMEEAAELMGEPAANALAEEAEEQRAYSYDDYVRPDAPWVLGVRPDDFLVPDQTKRWAGAPWCAFRIVRPLADVQADPVYRKAVRDQLDANTAPRPRRRHGVTSPKEDRDAGPTEDTWEGWEIWDKRDGRIRVLAEDAPEQFLRDEEHNLGIDGLPAEILQFNPVPWDFWGPSDVQEIHKQVLELNETRTLEMLHKRSAVAKFLVDKALLDPGDAEKFTRGQITLIQTNGPPGAGGVYQLQPQMSPDLFRVGAEIERDLRSVTGYGRNQQGEYDTSSRRTAHEVAAVQAALQLRADERRDQVADLLAALFQRKIHPMLFTFWTTPRAVQISGQGAWVEITPAEIRGDYLVQAIADSAVPLSRALRQQGVLMAYKTLSGNDRIDQRRLLQATLDAFDDVLPGDLMIPEETYQQISQQKQALMQLLSLSKIRPQQSAGGRSGERAAIPALGPAG